MMRDLARLGVGIILLALAVFASLQFPSESNHTVDSNLAGAAENSSIPDWHVQNNTPVFDQELPFLPAHEIAPNREALRLLPVSGSATVPFSEVPVQKPPAISDHYRALLPFRITQERDGASQSLVPVHPKPTFSDIQATPYRTHVVRAGDTLQTISQEYFGTAQRYLEIYTLNQGILSDPAQLVTGSTLKIPLR